VVATPQRILELQAASAAGRATTQIAVCEGLSRTLAAKLGQARVDFVLRRPVHPGALRLLLLHALYRGPEKRNARRVSIGAAARVRLGWRWRPAMLLELSEGACRLQLERAPAFDQRISLQLPAELTGRRALRLRGRVLRVAASGADEPVAGYQIAMVFDGLSPAASQSVAELLRQHDRGPAAWKEGPHPERHEPEPGEEASRAGLLTRRGPDAPDRRRSPRLRYAKPVLVKGEGASRVLMGRDLSTGGMRVVRDANLRVGAELKLALYGQDGIPPLMLRATVAREDGPSLLLRFEDPGDAGLEQLHRIMSSLPLSGADESGRSTPLVLSEIVEL
jgi:hypothetical protein